MQNVWLHRNKSTPATITLFMLPVLILSLLYPGGTVFGREVPVVETVDVNWWQLPVFALDDAGNPITDLKAEDIEIWLSGRRVDVFTFYKRQFQVQTEIRPTGQPEQPQTSPLLQQAKPGALKTNAVFLLFDKALSSYSCVSRSRAIAYNIVDTAAPNTQFIVLTIEPFKGLNYICGPTTDKKQLKEKIKKHVKTGRIRRLVDLSEFSAAHAISGKAPKSGQARSADSDTDPQLSRQAVSAYFTRKNSSFFYSFESLYLIFNAIRDNKFVYLFSEGVAESQQTGIKGGKTMYEFFMKKAARLLGRSGAVLFIVNPMGVHDASNLTAGGTVGEQGKYGIDPENPQFSSEIPTSGKNSLMLLADQSGGKYLEGRRENIVQRLDNIHKAYYEVSFQDIPGIKGRTRDIKIVSKRGGVQVHSFRSMEKPRAYAALSNLEKELLALNLVSGNPLFRGRMRFRHARVTAIGVKGNRLEYHVTLPDDFVKQKLELYKFSVKNESEVVKLEKEPLNPAKKKIVIVCPFSGQQTKETVYPYFALIDPAGDNAVVRVIGDRWLEPEQETRGRIMRKPEESRPQIDRVRMNRILEGAAGYCEKLADSAFHFICKEKIVESRKSLVTRRGLRSRRRVGIRRAMPVYSGVTNPELADKVKKYVFSYRLIKQEKSIREEREWYNDNTVKNTVKEKPGINKNSIVRPTAFLSEKAVFAPMTLLSRRRQPLFHFRFLKFEKKKGRSAAVIEAVPLAPDKHKTIYGTLWIDTQDFSVWKIKADPRSIMGFDQLTEFASKLGSRLQLSLETQFGMLRDGLRFPTEVRFIERYRGGRDVSINHGSTGWERSRTEFTYSDYRFFNVDVDIDVQKD